MAIIISEQRTAEWYSMRKGKITASEVYNIMGKGRGKDSTFSQSGISYLKKKVSECFMPTSAFIQYHERTSRETAALRWGTEHEDIARRIYESKLGYEVTEVGFIPLAGFENFAGGSPDGWLRNEGGIIEIKCPFTIESHVRHFMYKSPDELLAEEPQYYWQCVMNMLVSDTDFCDFISYSPDISVSKQMKVLRVHRDEERITALEDKIKLAVEFMKEQVRLINDTPNIITA